MLAIVSHKKKVLDECSTLEIFLVNYVAYFYFD